jgi:predicted dehydrogenase
VSFCREHGRRWVGDFDEALADPALDAVVLATPHGTVRTPCGRAARLPPGRSVLVDKSLSVVVARAAVDAAGRAGVVFAVGFNRRFHPSMVRLRRTLQEGLPGTIVTALSEHSALHGLADRGCLALAPRRNAAGPKIQFGVHQIDDMIDLVGLPRANLSHHAAHAMATAPRHSCSASPAARPGCCQAPSLRRRTAACVHGTRGPRRGARPPDGDVPPDAAGQPRPAVRRIVRGGIIFSKPVDTPLNRE